MPFSAYFIKELWAYFSAAFKKCRYILPVDRKEKTGSGERMTRFSKNNDILFAPFSAHRQEREKRIWRLYALYISLKPKEIREHVVKKDCLFIAHSFLFLSKTEYLSFESLNKLLIDNRFTQKRNKNFVQGFRSTRKVRQGPFCHPFHSLTQF